MKIFLRSFPVAAALILFPTLAPQLPVAAAQKESSSRRVSIETIHELRLSGYNDDDRGELQWRLEADSATADPSSASEDIRRTLWILNQLRLCTFGKNGEIFAEMTSPSGKFSPEKRAADSDEHVEVKGENFFVRGNGWSWSGHGHDNLIRVHRDVFVSAVVPEREERLTALSERLEIKGNANETLLTFSGNVKVAYGDIFMSCDELEILVPAVDDDAAPAAKSTRAKKSASQEKPVAPDESAVADSAGSASAETEKIAQTVRRIVGRGNLEITRGPLQLSGNSAEFFPQDDVFYVLGNARLVNTASLLNVHGEKAVGRLDKNFVELFPKTSPGDAPAGTPNAPAENVVAIEMPSFVEKKSSSAASAAATAARGKTLITGERLTVFITENENIISLFGNVKAADGTVRINADTLVVTTEPTDGSPLDEAAAVGASDDSANRDFAKIRTIAAAGNVRAEYSGRVLVCGRADVFPQDNLILLSVEPEIFSPDENASLSGERAEILLDRDVIEVFSAEGDAPDRRRVHGRLPPFSGKDLAAGKSASPKKSAETSAAETIAAGTSGFTEVFGDKLTLARVGDVSLFDAVGNVSLHSAELDGKSDRVTVFADPKKREEKSSSRGAGKSLSQIKKIIADGNVFFTQNGYELTGGRAVITPGIRLKEWIEDDAGNADGRAPFLIAVEPDAATGTRPRIVFPGGATGTSLGLSLPEYAEKSKKSAAETTKKSAAETTDGNGAGTALSDDEIPLTKKFEPKPSAEPAVAEKAAELPKKSYIESNSMELISGESRARFFLRGDVILVAGDGAKGACETVEGLLAPREDATGTQRAGTAAASEFEAKKVICRGDVRMRHEESSGRGNVLELFPPQNRAVLSGNAYFRGKDGVVLHPGNDRFVFDTAAREMVTGTEAGTGNEIPDQVSRPQIIIPPGGNRVFVVPKSVRGRDK